MKKTFISMILSIFIFPAYALQLDTNLKWQIQGLHQPESVAVDSQSGDIFVSNIHGAPNEANGKGYISRISATGQLQQQYWMRGFNAPKGMAIANGKLVVADLNRIHVIDIKNAKIKDSYTLPQAQFLNDVAVDTNGDFYITDMLDDAIYQLQQEQVKIWLKHQLLSHPNGIAIDADYIYIATWGKGMQENFTTQSPGGILRIHKTTQAIEVVKENVGNLDTVLKYNDSLIVNDWINGTVYEVVKGNKKTLSQENPGLADMTIVNDLLLMPFMHEGVVQAKQLTK